MLSAFSDFSFRTAVSVIPQHPSLPTPNTTDETPAPLLGGSGAGSSWLSSGAGRALSPRQAIFAHLRDEPEKVSLDAESHIFTQIRLGHQTPAIARLRDGGQQIILFKTE